MNMNAIRCKKCNFLNDPSMKFCLSCGNEIFSEAQSTIPTVENIQIPQQNNLAATGRSGSKYWIVGLLGCLGVLGLGIIGIILLAAISSSNIGKNVATNSQNVANNSNTPSTPEVKTNKSDSEIGNELLEILKDRPEAGKFKQLTANLVNKNDYFPLAKAAAQATYHNGSRYVAVSIGKFENFDDAKKNFDEQFANVKKRGGKTQILETSADGTINGVHQFKGTFSAEYCTKSAFCYRMASKDALALKNFIEKFITL